MMLRLPRNAITHVFKMGTPHGKRSITGLPCKRLEASECLLQPLGGIPFDAPDNLCQSGVFRELEKNMNVIGYASDLDGRRVLLAEGARKIRIQPILYGCRDPWLPLLRAKNKMNVIL